MKTNIDALLDLLKPHTCILIDSKEGTVVASNLLDLSKADNYFPSIRPFLGGGFHGDRIMVELVHLGGPLYMAVDEEGLLKGSTTYFSLPPMKGLFAGNAVIFLNSEKTGLPMADETGFLNLLAGVMGDPSRRIGRVGSVVFYKDEAAVEAAMEAGKLDRPRSTITTFGKGGDPVEETLWEWRGGEVKG